VKDPARAAHACTAEPSRPHLNDDSTSLPGQVGQGAGVMAGELTRNAAAKRAGALQQLRHSENGDAVGRGQDLHDQEIRWHQRQDTTGQGGESYQLP